MPFDPTQPTQPVRGLGRATSITNNESWLDKIANALVGDEGLGKGLFGKAMTGLDQLSYGHLNTPDPSQYGTVSKSDTVMGDPSWSMSAMPFGPKGFQGAAKVAQDVGENGGLFNKGIKILDQEHMQQNFGGAAPLTQPRPSGPWDYMNQPEVPRPQGPLAWGKDMVDVPGGSTLPAGNAGVAGARPHMASGVPDDAIKMLKEEAMNRFKRQTNDVPIGELMKLNKLR